MSLYGSLTSQTINSEDDDTSDPNIHPLPTLIDAARAYVTVGEWIRVLESLFGIWYERGVV